MLLGRDLDIPRALARFGEAMASVDSLLEMESKKDPLDKVERPLVMGLRGGAAVLMVSAFEGFLKDVFGEYMQLLIGDPAPVRSQDLPDELRICNMYENLERVIQPARRSKKKSKIAVLPDVKAICGDLAEERIVCTAFSFTEANPDEGVVRKMFSNVGFKSIFERIFPEFRQLYKDVTGGATFVPTELERIVKRRNDVAHTGDMSRVTRQDLAKDVNILNVLSGLLDQQLRAHIKRLIREYAVPSYSDLSQLFG